MTVNLLGLDHEALKEFCAGLGEKPFRARQLLRWIHHAGAEIIDDDVGTGDQRAHGGHVLRILEVERGAALVAIQAAEHRVVVTGDRLERRAREIARALAFDLDHVGAVVAEHLRAHRAQHHLREVDHAHAGERKVVWLTHLATRFI